MKTLLLAAMMGTSLFASAMPALPFSVAAEEEKTADVYILAGQSNAVGCSNLDQQVYGGDGETYRTLLTSYDERNESGYENVYYYGAVNISADETTLPNPELTTIKMGLGQSSSYSGPELGMANILAENTSENHIAVIIKLAAGGVFLGDYDGSFSPYYFTQLYGNWAAPSTIARWEEEGKRIHANTGLLYTRLLDFITQGMEKIAEKGYTPSIKGYLWMQGESDSEDKTLSADYYQNLCELIGDLRSDVAERTNDKNAAYRPFVIGKITPTYNFPALGMNIIRANQDAAAKDSFFAYTVETDDLPVLDTPNKAICGSDICHFNAKDIYTLGQRFASAVLENTAAYGYCVETSGTGGSVTENSFLSNGESINISYETEEGYALSRVYLDGQDVTEETLRDGYVTVTPDGTDEIFHTITLEFSVAQTEVSEGGSDDNPSETESDSILQIVIPIIVAVVLLAVCIIVIVVLVKRRKGGR